MTSKLPPYAQLYFGHEEPSGTALRADRVHRMESMIRAFVLDGLTIGPDIAHNIMTAMPDATVEEVAQAFHDAGGVMEEVNKDGRQITELNRRSLEYVRLKNGKAYRIRIDVASVASSTRTALNKRLAGKS
jgi:hypothetical protein